MLRPALAALLLTSMPLAVAAAAGPADAPPGASSCSGCHPPSQAGVSPVPRLVGRNASEIVQTMQAFRTGQKPTTIMDRVAKGFSDDEIAAIARWYAAQKD